MKKDFNFILYACIAAVILSAFTLISQLRPREKLFSEDNPLDTVTETIPQESEVDTVGTE